MLFIDAEDSFTWNIISECEIAGMQVEYINHRKILETPESDWPIFFHHSTIAFGPGPGHPDEYPHLLQFIRVLRKQKQFFLVGFCLGHQLLCLEDGYGVNRSILPMHGRAQVIELPCWDELWLTNDHGKRIEVQRYNSLAVNQLRSSASGDSSDKLLVQNGEVLIRLSRDSLSYQFHPESIGTNFRQVFFRPIFQIESMMSQHDASSKTQRNLRSKNP